MCVWTRAEIGRQSEGQREDLERLLWQAAYVAPPRLKLWEPSLRAYVAGEIVMPEAV